MHSRFPGSDPLLEATPIRRVVHVVDDDQSVRTALSRLLRTAHLDVHAYSSAREFLERGAEDCDVAACVVLDLSMPGIDGLELQDALAREPSALPVVFLTGHGDIPASVRAMKAGAVDFLTKPVDRQRLLAAIETALERDAVRRRQRDHLTSIAARFAALTPREQEVFDLLVTGKLNKQVGIALGTTERTVKAHRAQVMRKLEVESVAELVRVAIALGRTAAESPT